MKVSVIIPVLNDAIALQRCLAALPTGNRAPAIEVIVVDGGNSLEVVDACRACGATYLAASPGRAVQMNAGAVQARGELLWFLHADCTPASGSIEALAELDASVEWGCFAHRIDQPGMLLRVIECADNLRARFARLPYGDQGIFVRRALFSSIGGYARVPILEDLMLAETLRSRAKFRLLTQILKADGRRWAQDGIVRTTATNWRILWMHYIYHKPAAEIAEWRRNRSKR